MRYLFFSKESYHHTSICHQIDRLNSSKRMFCDLKCETKSFSEIVILVIEKLLKTSSDLRVNVVRDKNAR